MIPFSRPTYYNFSTPTIPHYDIPQSDVHADSIVGTCTKNESKIRYYSRKVPIAFTKAKGVNLWDAQGREYLDMISGVGVANVGHNHPHIKDTLRQFMDEDRPWSMLDLVTETKANLIEKLFTFLPENLQQNGRILFCAPTGADSVEAALKIAKLTTKNKQVLAFSGAYHGVSTCTMSLTANRENKKHFEPMPFVNHVPYPFPQRSGISQDSILELLKSQIMDPSSGPISAPAALIMEAIQGEGGVIPAPHDFLKQVRSITREHNVPLILDEIQTGFGRTGKMFGFQHSGIEPDIMTLSKSFAGGLPISAVIYDSSTIPEENLIPGIHKGTFRGSSISFAAASAVLDIIKNENLIENAQKIGEILKPRLDALKEKHDFIGDIRGLGAMWAVEIVDTNTPSNYHGSIPFSHNPDLAQSIQRKCLEHGLLLETCGQLGSSIRILPPLVATPQDINTGIERFEYVLDSTQP